MIAHIPENGGLDPYKRTLVIELEQYEGKIISTEIIEGGKGIRLKLDLRDDIFIATKRV